MLARPMQSRSTFAAVVAALFLAACGAASPSGGTTPAAQVPDRITADSYAAARREFFSLPIDDPARAALRAKLVAYLDANTSTVLEAGDYDAVVEQFSELSRLYTPEDYEQHHITPALERPAKWIVAHGSPTGDEARVLSALLVMKTLHPDQPAWEQQYQEVAQWGRSARSTIDSIIERYGRLLEVWEMHAQLTPAPEVLAAVAHIYVDRQNAIQHQMQSEGHAMAGLSPQERFTLPALLSNTPFEVAAVYLSHGDLANAITQLQALGDSDVQGRLLTLLEQAKQGGSDGDDAVLEVAQAYRDARPDVARGLCRLGHRRSPTEPRFVVCLARTAMAEDRYADGTAWYAEAIRLAPTDRRTYDEALERLDQLIEGGLVETDPKEASALAHDAERILDARKTRWPDSEPPLAPARLQLLIGQLDMNAGHVDDARKHLQRSIDAHETPEALLQLGFLEERLGKPQDALRLYRRALDQTSTQDHQSGAARAHVLENLGDAYGASGQPGQATRMYQEALSVWDRASGQLHGSDLASAQVRRGIVLDHLARHDDAKAAFREAISAAPHVQEVYAQILSHLVTIDPDPALAAEVFHRAVSELTLDPEWRVYFALWVKILSDRAGQPAGEEATRTLDDASHAHAWWGMLAKLGTGHVTLDEALGSADGLGQKAEAYFYGGAWQLTTGHASEARAAFQGVLATHMVMYYEYAMAQALLQQQAAPTDTSGNGTPAQPAAQGPAVQAPAAQVPAAQAPAHAATP